MRSLGWRAAMGGVPACELDDFDSWHALSACSSVLKPTHVAATVAASSRTHRNRTMGVTVVFCLAR